MTGDGFYCCNQEVSLSVDAEEFERLCREEKSAHSYQEKIEKCMKAIALYRGEYMSGYNDVYWLASMTTFYQSLYLNTVKECASLLEKCGRYVEMEQIIRDALDRESLDEELHTYFVRSLIGQGKQKLALEQYQKSSRILYENLGITDLGSMKGEYEKLMRQEHEVQSDLAVVRRELCGEKEEGAFVCEYGVFKSIYQLERRRSERFGISVFLVLVSIRQDKAEEGGQGTKEGSASCMKLLEEVLTKVLRSGDVIARYSQSQYILMLPTCQYETVERVTNRIDRKLCGKLKDRNRVTLQYSMGEII